MFRVWFIWLVNRLQGLKCQGSNYTRVYYQRVEFCGWIVWVFNFRSWVVRCPNQHLGYNCHGTIRQTSQYFFWKELVRVCVFTVLSVLFCFLIPSNLNPNISTFLKLMDENIKLGNNHINTSQVNIINEAWHNALALHRVKYLVIAYWCSISAGSFQVQLIKKCTVIFLKNKQLLK